ncbi:hypothetical protein E0H54_25200 [Rhizobium leguminosarum bv. viciae]|nr:hypothetical protein E0H54_25200 [Rhizobium leguminosarum bv. viciae]
MPAAHHLRKCAATPPPARASPQRMAPALATSSSMPLCADSNKAAPSFQDDCAPGFRDDLAPRRPGDWCHARI